MVHLAHPVVEVVDLLLEEGSSFFVTLTSGQDFYPQHSEYFSIPILTGGHLSCQSWLS